MHPWRGALALGGLITVGAWSLGSSIASSHPRGGSSDTAAHEPAVDGSPQERRVALAAAQMAAIVLVTDGTKPDGAFCSGAFIAPDWVITAAHCLAIPSPVVVASPGDGATRAVLPVARAVRHPDRDIALLNVSPSPIAQSIAPIRIVGSDFPSLVTGVVVEMAGYGAPRSRPTRALHFLAESIASTDAKTITVSSLGASGACDGDSGGPLLARDSDGSPVAIGILSAGSAACRGKDEYTRLDVLGDWAKGVIARPYCGPAMH